MTQPAAVGGSTQPYGLIDAVAPDPTRTNFPVPRLVTARGPSGVSVSESFLLSGTLLPGQWLLLRMVREFGWQVRAGNYLTGATVVPIGDPLLTMVFGVKIWTDLDAATFRGLLKTKLRKPVGLLPGSATSAGLGIDHPAAKDLGVNAVVVKSVTPLMNPLVTSGGRGAWTAVVEFLEYRKPLPALPTPNTIYPDKAPPVPSATDNLQKEIQSLSNTAASKAAQLATALSGGPKP